jgi:opacity protein-like surface antigen
MQEARNRSPRRRRRAAALAFALAAASAAVPAAAQTAVSLDAGTLGAGVQVGHSFSPRFDGRLGIAAWTVTGRRKVADLTYEARGELRSAQLLADWHPGASAFRLTAGVLYDATRITGTSVAPPSGVYRIGGIDVPASLVGSLRGRVDFPTFAPYAGIGWGRAAGGGRWGFHADLGAAYQGHGKVTLTPEIPAGSPILQIPGALAVLDLAVAREEAEAERKIAKYDVYPVVSLGIVYRP